MGVVGMGDLRRTPRRWAALMAVVMALASLAARHPAVAETPPREARELYQAGLRSYRAGDYDDAIAKLQASYRLVPAPELLYDLAQAHRRKRDCAGAATLYRQFLAETPTGPGGVLAQTHLAEMEACLAGAATAAAAGPSAAPTAGPTPPVVLSAPPPAATTGIDPGHALLRSGPTDGAPPVASPTHRWRFAGRRTAIGAGITALGLAVASGYFAWRADQAANQVSGTFLPGRTWGEPGMSAQLSGQNNEALGAVAAVGALLSGGIAAWLATRR
jgi:hypothetical protein